MSELEKQQRDTYQRNRQKWIRIQALVALILAVITLVSAVVWYTLDKHEYVQYVQNGDVVYHAYLADNEFYDAETLNGNHAYVADLIDSMTADFRYGLRMDADKVAYRYTYRVDAQLVITDGKSNAPLYNPTYEILPTVTTQSEGQSIYIERHVDIDYQAYNEIASKFIKTYELKNVTSRLYVRMYVDVAGAGEELNTDSAYTVELAIPLVEDTVKPVTSSTVPTDIQQVRAYDGFVKACFKTVCIVYGVWEVLAIVVLVLFTILTRDKHIDYARRLQKILKKYKSYIQRILTPFDTEGYQVLRVAKFAEMLEIRDTMQMPVLLHENEDCTAARFYIATNTKILYIYEILVEEETPMDEAPVVAPAPAAAPCEAVAPAPAEPIDEAAPITVAKTGEPVVIFMEPEQEPEEEPGQLVVDVAWPEDEGKERTYRYDPVDDILEPGDIVLVPSVDANSNRRVLREATVLRGNYRVDPETLTTPLKKVISIVRRRSDTQATR